MTQVEFIGAHKIYGNGNKQVPALTDVCLSIRQGEFWTVIGPSGSGKTTLLRCLAGFEALTSGSIEVAGSRVIGPGRDRMMVFQDFSQLFDWHTVLGNIMLALKAAGRGQSAAERRQLADYYLDLAGLGKFAHFYPYQLSGGMKQRAAIIRALGVQPAVLLLDEPFGSLDAITRTGLQSELLRIWRETMVTIVFVTHSIEEALLLSDYIAVLAPEGVLKEVVKSNLPRPRSPEQAGFSALWQHLHELLKQPGVRQPDSRSPAAAALPLATPASGQALPVN